MLNSTLSRSLALCLAGAFLLPRCLPAQTAADASSEQRIRDLENRLAVVEAQLEQLLRDRNAATPTVAAASPQPIAPIAPAAPQPPSGRFEIPPDLIPEVGKIGAEAGLLASASANPFDLNHGEFYGAYLDLPLLDRPAWLHGKLGYELMIGLSRSQSMVASTSNVAQVTNLSVLTALSPLTPTQNLSDSLTGTGSAPFPVTTANKLNLRLLEVVPFSFKYTTTALDRWRLRAYGLVGFGTYVIIHSENPAPAGLGIRPDATLPAPVLQAVEQAFGGTAPFGSPLVAGQISQSSQLIARGLPGGDGSIDVGLQTGAGLEFRLTRTLSLGFDARFNRIAGTNGNLNTYGTRIGFHF